MDDWEKAGKIAAEALEFGKKLIKIDASLLEVTEKIENKIKELNGKCAFPINISMNQVAAHYSALPNDETRFKENDLVKLDIGIHVNGCIGDIAYTIDLGDNKELVMASEKALKEAIKIIKPGVKLFEIGKVIQDKIAEFNLSPIINLSGHEIKKYKVHSGLTIPNYNNNDKTELKEGQIIAIEPFATKGEGKVIEGKKSGIYRLEQRKPVRDLNIRKILDFIEKNFKELPFAKRWINFPMAEFSLNVLEREKIIYQYPQLREISNALVSQAEHTVKVGKGVLTLS